MPDKTWERIQQIFHAASELPAEEQARFLDAACLGDQSLRCEVAALLDADRRAASSLSAVVGSGTALLLDDLPAGLRLGPYRVIRQIGRGGMGAVYLADRDDDHFQKQVAIKVVKRGMDTADLLGRFRHERQILANLDHPYIARLMDGGSTPDGRPFFVMDYIEGQPIHLYCQGQHLADAITALKAKGPADPSCRTGGASVSRVKRSGCYFAGAAGVAGLAAAAGVALVLGATFLVDFLVCFFEVLVTAGFAVLPVLAGGGTCDLANIMGIVATASATVNKLVFMAFFSWRAFLPATIPWCA